MKLNELPQAIQEKLQADRKVLAQKHINTAYTIELYNEAGTRYFRAKRCCQSWADTNGNYMPFGGGTYWIIFYGAVQFRATKSCMGTVEYELVNGKRYDKSANGTVIPKQLQTKKQVIDLINQIGIFTL